MFVWIQDYEPAFIIRDVVAGLTIGLMLIPQSLAYAELAGLDLGFNLTVLRKKLLFVIDFSKWLL